MRIAIYISNVLLLGNEWKEMVEVLFQQLASQKVDDEFVFILNRPLQDDSKTTKNCSVVMVPPETGNGLLLKYWYDYTLPSILRKKEIDVLVSASGVCSLGAKLPQILFLKDLSFLTLPKKMLKKQALFIQKRFSTCLEKVDGIVVANSFLKNELTKKYSVDAKTSVANHFASSLFQPVDWREKEKIKEKYSEGKEYFLVNDNNESFIDWMVLLKAFSFFKKRQLSNMKLLIIGGMDLQSLDFTKKLATYKYRTDVKLLGDLPLKEQVVVVAAAYCLVNIATCVGLAMPIMQALQSGVPIIAPSMGGIAETVAAAALYADQNSPEAIAEQMKTVYKDENLRSQMIVAGLEQTKKLTLENSADDMWKCIQKVMD